MPRKRRRISAFVKILLVVTVICGGLVAGGYYVIRSVHEVELASPPESGCVIDTPRGLDELDTEQAANAATIGGVAFNRDLDEHAVVVAYATVWQESKFTNVPFGDRDSVGLFQQRPSQEWGERDQLLDPVYASGAFYEELVTISDYESIPVHEAAQGVQRSADGFAYDRHVERSRDMARAFTGRASNAVHCWYPAEEAESAPDIAAAEAEMARVFGTAPADLPEVDGSPTGDPGWAMALWAVSNAREYGITSVTYDGMRWRADGPKAPENATAGWRPHEGDAPEEPVLR